MDVSRFVRHLTSARDYEDQLCHIETIEPRPASYADPAEPIRPEVARILAAQGITRLYSHQAEALDAIRAGKNVVVVTGTASGKTLCYNIPVLESLLEDPESRALYIFPTKALAQDQLQTLRRLTAAAPLYGVRAGAYDGDTPQDERRKLRDDGRIVLTNPDMLHAGILPRHARWAHFFERLRYVVIDEVHAYRGLFGANVANVVRRLRRLAAHYGAEPRFVLASATIGNPRELAESLIGLPVVEIANDGSPRGRKVFLIWNPPHIDDARIERRSPNTEAHHLLCELVRESCQTICFVRARATAEIIYRMVQERLRKHGSRLGNAVRSYRGGYTAEDRREIERMLFSGDLLGVVSTNALELGIDIGSMEACLIVGYPGTIASLRQQAGRAGRGTEDSLAVLVAHNQPIDQYLVKHPEFIFGRSPEEAVVDARNPHILALHLRCACRELPVSAADEEHYGEYLYALLEILEDNADVRRRGDRWFWAKPDAYPAGEFSLRLASDNTYLIIDVSGETPTTIGEMDELSAFSMLHTQAIYLHQGDTYFVRELNLARKHAYVEIGDFDYYTQAVTRATIHIDEVTRESAWRVSQTGFGDVTVTELVVMFRKMKFGSRDSIGYGNLDLPPMPLETVAMWLRPPAAALDTVRRHGRSPQDGLLGIANALAGVMPLYTMSDPTDIGTSMDSTCFGAPTLFLYDRYPHGAGFAQRAYDRIEELMTACLDLVASCGCDEGCPSCVGAPEPYGGIGRDGSTRGAVPDREAALCLLHELLQREPYVPKPLPAGGSLSELSARPEVQGVEVPVPPPPERVKRLPEAVDAKIRRRIQRLRGT